MPDESDRAATAAWIAVDWGTSNLRAWVMDDDDVVIARIEDDRGMGRLNPDDYDAVLSGLLAPVLTGSTPLPVIACGMVGARQGWAEAPYRTVPCTPTDATQALSVLSDDPRLSVWILAGLCQQDPPDVMRGEETQIAGFLADNPEFNGVLCLPGTHSKWARLRDGQVHGFRTSLTGEVYDLLARRSVLRHSVSEIAWDDAAFDAAVVRAAVDPGSLLTDLFGIRAAGLIDSQHDSDGAARLSGQLIGAEIGTMRDVWSDQPVAILGQARLAGLYARALSAMGASPVVVDADIATLRGLIAARHQTRGQAS